MKVNKALFDAKIKPDEVLIDMLEKQLAQAKEGKIIGMAIAIEYSNRDTGNCFVVEHAVTLLGQLSILTREIIDLDITLRSDN